MLGLLIEEQVADQLTVSLSTLRRWRLCGQGPRFMKVGSLVRYRPEEHETRLGSLPIGGSNAVRARMDTGESGRCPLMAHTK
jgi:predicted site-specific integrase-resolvase